MLKNIVDSLQNWYLLLLSFKSLSPNSSKTLFEGAL